jgi:hypothetical protein
MLKKYAIELLGGTQTQAAKACRVSPQAVKDWPDVLPNRIADRIEAALWRGLPASVRARSKLLNK